MPAAPDDEPDHPEQIDLFAEDVIAGRDPGTAILGGQGAAVAVVAAGGVIGALARWSLQASFPAGQGFPFATFGINVTGCLLMGVLVVLVSEAREAHPLVRPFLGVGVLGGYTTFSSYAVEAGQLLVRGHLALSLAYLAATVVATLVAVVVGLAVTRRLAGLR